MNLRKIGVVFLGLAVAATAAPRPVLSQVAVSGRVTIQERPGERTTDLDNTVVYLLRTDSATARTRPAPVSIAMNGRAFSPRVRVVTPGSRVTFPNEDPFSHNIFSTTPGAVFDLGLYPAGRSESTIFRRGGAYPVYCNIHPRMTAFVVVAPSPWYAQADGNGEWRIPGVPAGRYRMVVWHDRAPADTSDLVVTRDGQSGLTTRLDARGFRFSQHKNKFGREYANTGRDRY